MLNLSEYNVTTDRQIEEYAFSCMGCEFIELLKECNLKACDVDSYKRAKQKIPKLLKQELRILKTALELRMR